VLIKAADEDGDATWAWRDTGNLSDEELIGALTVQLELLKRGVLSTWSDD
jgi:hypothetical protein